MLIGAHLVPYLLANAIFLLVQRPLLQLGDMTAVLTGHKMLLLANLPILSV